MQDPEGVPSDDDVNVVDEFAEHPMDRLMRSLPGAMTGAAMTGLAKGMGMWIPPEEIAVIREAGEPPPDPDDPIEVSIDPDHPENTRIVFRVKPVSGLDPGAADGPVDDWPPTTSG